MIDDHIKNLFVDLWNKNPASIIFAITYVVGFNVSLFLWWRKNINLPNWFYWTTLWLFDLKILKRVFLQGPAVFIMIIWMFLGLIVTLVV